MFMDTNSYDVDVNGKESRLLFWLRLDYWDFDDACLLIADIDPSSLVMDEKNKFLKAKNLKGATFGYLSDDLAMDSEDMLLEYQNKYNNLRKWLDPRSLSNYPPSHWIDLAISKKIHIPWFDFAIDIGFCETHKTKTSLAKSDKTIIESNYTTDLMILLNQAANQFFSPRKVQDAKQGEVSEWIRNKGKELKINISENVADAMFTIIKPHDHNPKIRRVEPLA